MSSYSPVLVTAYCDPEKGKSKEDIFEQPSVPILIIGPHHIPTCAALDAIALLSARHYVEQKSHRAAISSAQAPEWQAAMQHGYSSLMDNGTLELVDLPLFTYLSVGLLMDTYVR
jgi:hypothetical protein